MSGKRLEITQNDESPVAVRVLAESIVAISEGVRRLRAGPLNDKCLRLLIQHAAARDDKGRKIPDFIIRDVLDGIESLEKTYLRKKN